MFSSGIQAHDLVFPCDYKAFNNDETFSTTLQSLTNEGDSSNLETAPERPFYNDDDTCHHVMGCAQSLDVSDDVSDLSDSDQSSTTIGAKEDAHLKWCISRSVQASGLAICAFSRSLHLGVVDTRHLLLDPDDSIKVSPEGICKDNVSI